MHKSDRELGMFADITRRDFLDGVAHAVGGIAAAGAMGSSLLGLGASASAAEGVSSEATASYPPSLTGMRGQNQAALQYAHALRDGGVVAAPENTGEKFDLVIVGAGMSGLGSAYFYRKQRPKAKILILDNHDDFGGHARRNEFNVDGRQVIAFGGTMMITSVSHYSGDGQQLLSDIGVNLERFTAAAEASPVPYATMGMQSACFFDRETYGKDTLVKGFPDFAGFAPTSGEHTWREFVAKSPMSAEVRHGLVRMADGKQSFMPGATREQLVAALSSMTYEKYLLDVVRVHPDVIKFIYNLDFHGMNAGAGPDSYSAYAAWRRFKTGFNGLDLGEVPPFGSIHDGIHFPDGNGGVARLLVRWLIPAALPGNTMEDAYARRVDYSQLDRPENDVRIRLGSTVVNATHGTDPASAKEVTVSYIRGGKTQSVTAGAVVMACFNAVVPYLCPEMPATQKDALHMSVRVPLVYTSVALRNWRAHAKLGVSNIYFPNGLHSQAGLDFATPVGPYRPARSPDEPTFLNMWMWPCKPGSGLDFRQQFRAARARLLGIPFEEFERDIRTNLGRALAAGGFDPARDIAGIIVNRWGHGYAGGSNGLFDPNWPHDQQPWVIGRKRFGRIAIANSDAGATCLTAVALDQAHRAVTELLADVQPTLESNFPFGTRL